MNKLSTAEIIEGQKQPAPFVQFQVVEGNTLLASIYGLDKEGRLWLNVLSPVGIWMLEENSLMAKDRR